jgi:hypothetical protein
VLKTASNRAYHVGTSFHELHFRTASLHKAILLCKLHVEAGRVLHQMRTLQVVLQVSGNAMLTSP